MVPVTAAILLDDRNRVLLARRSANDKHALKWEFPGGKLRDGESPERCLARELDEELSIAPEIGEIFHVVSHQYPHQTILLLAYLCRFTGGEIKLHAHQTCEWVEASRLLDFDLTEADRQIALKFIRRYAIHEE